MNLNRVFLLGRLTRDPQTRALPSGQSVASFGLATDRFYNDKNGQKQQQTEFHNIVFFGRLADIVSQYLKKGSLVFVEGRIRNNTWQDNAGNQRSKTEIVGEKMQLGPKSSSPSYENNQQSRPSNNSSQKPPQEDIPIIEEEEIDIKDIPF